jgi:prolipoprotein diacylglyceryltransferase
MNQPASKYEIILTACISGSVIGGVFGCFVLVLAQIDYHANPDMLVIWLSSCILLFTIVGARIGYQISQNKCQKRYIIVTSNNKAVGNFTA